VLGFQFIDDVIHILRINRERDRVRETKQKVVAIFDDKIVDQSIWCHRLQKYTDIHTSMW